MGVLMSGSETMTGTMARAQSVAFAYLKRAIVAAIVAIERARARIEPLLARFGRTDAKAESAADPGANEATPIRFAPRLLLRPILMGTALFLAGAVAMEFMLAHWILPQSFQSEITIHQLQERLARKDAELQKLSLELQARQEALAATPQAAAPARETTPAATPVVRASATAGADNRARGGPSSECELSGEGIGLKLKNCIEDFNRAAQKAR